MDRFITERETEDLLDEEVRVLAMPNGERRSVRAFRLVWSSYDIVLRSGAFSEPEVITLADQHSARTGQAFETSLERVVGTIHEKLARF
ncbi:hypothetical protein [Novosphingobium album (ex Liu et al. 2023)]|uniref:Uncharacterized protein n=1 Tax=Novosphingobium album (ex Liu et al. 2023) TaxID=3031130 RepID=A0ABT5WVA5_9SPHN|nr:hypothetical protein [Novosphingobium album (ex Liu et al. 2023)]MDE8653851.1 hypothetical protein [Novosphingobium album (ex Liu et al. 2023)]